MTCYIRDSSRLDQPESSEKHAYRGCDKLLIIHDSLLTETSSKRTQKVNDLLI